MRVLHADKTKAIDLFIFSFFFFLDKSHRS